MTHRNGFLLFISSCLSGCGQMYQGYMKRGLSLLLAFCLYFFFGISCILIVLISGLLGWLLCTWRVRKGGGMV